MVVAKKQRIFNFDKTTIAFGTPIHQSKYEHMEQFNDELAAIILEMKAHTPGESYSNVGGWQSDSGFLERLPPHLSNRLRQMIAESIRSIVATMLEVFEFPQMQVGVTAWANVNERGHSNVAHIHPGSQWSGVYYVALQPEAGGALVFTDPRTAALVSNHPLNPFDTPHIFTIKPTPGTIVVFPSFLYHSVTVYTGDAPRISIAFNVA